MYHGIQETCKKDSLVSERFFLTVVHHATKYIYYTRYILPICYIVCIKLCNYPCCKYHHLIHEWTVSRSSHYKRPNQAKSESSSCANPKEKQQNNKNSLQNRLHHHSKICVQKKGEFWNKFVIICHIIYHTSYPCKFELVAKTSIIAIQFLGGKFVSDLTSARLHPNPKDDW